MTGLAWPVRLGYALAFAASFVALLAASGLGAALPGPAAILPDAIGMELAVPGVRDGLVTGALVALFLSVMWLLLPAATTPVLGLVSVVAVVVAALPASGIGATANLPSGAVRGFAPWAVWASGVAVLLLPRLFALQGAAAARRLDWRSRGVEESEIDRWSRLWRASFAGLTVGSLAVGALCLAVMRVAPLASQVGAIPPWALPALFLAAVGVLAAYSVFARVERPRTMAAVDELEDDAYAPLRSPARVTSKEARGAGGLHHAARHYGDSE